MRPGHKCHLVSMPFRSFYRCGPKTPPTSRLPWESKILLLPERNRKASWAKHFVRGSLRGPKGDSAPSQAGRVQRDARRGGQVGRGQGQVLHQRQHLASAGRGRGDTGTPGQSPQPGPRLPQTRLPGPPLTPRGRPLLQSWGSPQMPRQAADPPGNRDASYSTIRSSEVTHLGPGFGGPSSRRSRSCGTAAARTQPAPRRGRASGPWP